MVNGDRILGGRDFLSPILREADQRERMYLPVREKGALKALTLKEMYNKEEVGEGELRLGGQTRRVSRVRCKIAWRLSREHGIPLIGNPIRKKLQKKRDSLSLNLPI